MGYLDAWFFYDKLSIQRRGVQKNQQTEKTAKTKKKTLIENTELREKNQRNWLKNQKNHLVQFDYRNLKLFGTLPDWFDKI